MKVTVTVQATIEVEFDENSQEFKDLFENYNNYFAECDKQEFAEIIAKQVATYGISDDIEGVGLVKRNGKMQRNIDHPIDVVVQNGYDINGMIDFDVSESYTE